MPRWDFFHRTETNRGGFDRSKPCTPYLFNLPDGTTLAAALEHAYANGLPRGSARAGCVEVQNADGIYRREDGGRIDVSTARRQEKVLFTPWTDLDQD